MILGGNVAAWAATTDFGVWDLLCLGASVTTSS